MTECTIEADYIHNNGDKERLMINGFDGNGNAWVTWPDGLKNIIPTRRLRYNTSKLFEPRAKLITWRDVP